MSKNVAVRKRVQFFMMDSAGNKIGNTPLHTACRYDNPEDIAILLREAGVESSAGNHSGVPGIEINARDHLWNTPLHTACQHNNPSAVTALLREPTLEVSARNKFGETPLLTACRHNSPQAVAALFGAPGIDVNERQNDERNGTPLYMACLHSNITSSQLIAMLLAAPGIDVNARCNRGLNAVMVLAGICDSESLKMMVLDPRVDLDVRNDDGNGIDDVVGFLFCKRGYDERENKEMCLNIIREERRKRANIAALQEEHVAKEQVEVDKASTDVISEQVEVEEASEDIKTKVRSYYINKIDKLNINKDEKIQSLRMKEETREKHENSLRKEQGMQMNDLRERHTREENQLRNRKATRKRKNDLEEKHKKELQEVDEKYKEGMKALKSSIEEEKSDIYCLKKIKDGLSNQLFKVDNPNIDETNAQAIAAVKEILTCSICLDMGQTTIWMCKNGHLMCQHCKNKMKKDNCPSCKEGSVDIRARHVEQVASVLFSNN